MKDEEKAEEILQTKGSMTFCAKGCGYTEKVKELIAIGLDEGRKEIFPSFTKKKEMLETKVSILEEEIAELKKKLEVREKFLNGKSRLIVEDTFEIERLKAQINKLKNCVNCKHRPMQPTNKMCQYADVCSVDYDRWEIQE